MKPLLLLINHALGTLPDSIAARKHLLRAVLQIMHSEHPDYRRTLLMLSYLEKHEAEQARLPLDISGAGPSAAKAPEGRRDGNGNGESRKQKGDGKA